MKRFLLLALLPLRLFAAEETTFTVLTYNIKGLPAFIAQGYEESRFGEIGRILAERQKKGDGPEIVLLQESFVDRTAELRELAAYPFTAKGPDSVRSLGVDSGLYILSKFPILEQKNRAFGESLCEDWDCYANKGVQFARIQLPGVPFTLEVFNTHMQASRSFDGVRRKQVEVLAQFVKENHREGSAVIFAGDFNFRPALGEGSYKDFLAKTGLKNAGEICATESCLGGKQDRSFWRSIVDHQFVGLGSAFKLLPMAMNRSFAAPVNGMRLSDHQGYELKYRLNWGNEKPKVMKIRP